MEGRGLGDRPELRAQPLRIHDDDPLGRGRDGTRVAELTERARDDLTNRTDALGELLLGHRRDERGSDLMVCGDVEELARHTLAHRRERAIDEVIKARDQDAADFLQQRVRDAHIAARRRAPGFRTESVEHRVNNRLALTTAFRMEEQWDPADVAPAEVALRDRATIGALECDPQESPLDETDPVTTMRGGLRPGRQLVPFRVHDQRSDGVTGKPREEAVREDRSQFVAHREGL